MSVSGMLTGATPVPRALRIAAGGGAAATAVGVGVYASVRDQRQQGFTGLTGQPVLPALVPVAGIAASAALGAFAAGPSARHVGAVTGGVTALGANLVGGTALHTGPAPEHIEVHHVNTAQDPDTTRIGHDGLIETLPASPRELTDARVRDFEASKAAGGYRYRDQPTDPDATLDEDKLLRDYRKMDTSGNDEVDEQEYRAAHPDAVSYDEPDRGAAEGMLDKVADAVMSPF